jgi:hypothetical protein
MRMFLHSRKKVDSMSDDDGIRSYVEQTRPVHISLWDLQMEQIERVACFVLGRAHTQMMSVANSCLLKNAAAVS